MTNIYKKFVAMTQAELNDMPSKDKHGWDTGKFKNFRSLQPDKKGDIGEDYIVWLLEQSGRKATCTRRTDPTMKHWDIVVDTDRITLEVKTATLGYSTSSFQHENLEQNRNCDGIIFFDVAPNTVYITFMCKHTFDWNKAHRRRHGIQYKKDFRLKWVKENNSEIKTLDDFVKGYKVMLAEIKKIKKEQSRGKYQI
jgi:hypothetical protein